MTTQAQPFSERLSPKWNEGYQAMKPKAANAQAEAYLKSLGNNDANSIASIEARIRSKFMPNALVESAPLINFNDAMTIVETIYECMMKRKGGNFECSDSLIYNISNVVKYFIHDNSSKFSKHKGLYFYGSYGVGKTMLFRVIDSLLESLGRSENERFKIVSAKEIIRIVSEDKNTKIINSYKFGNLVIDDLGEEEKTIGLFRDDVSPMDYLLSLRYEAYQRGYMTHFTTNLSGEGIIKEKYGLRIHDRFKEMVTPVLFTGDSLRK